jgi:iron(III) transport system substrate-binding protein
VIKRVAWLALLTAALGCGSLVGSPPDKEDKPRSVVLYSSVDDEVLRQVIDAFEEETNITVKLVGDTEATKTFGLVERLLGERKDPRADVWWSSEPFGTIRLSTQGVLAPYTSKAEDSIKGGWPRQWRGPDWYGFALRARVIAYNTDKLKEADVPHTLRELTDPRWEGRLGMARPQFGTTRGHISALTAKWGEQQTASWLLKMKRNKIRLFDGNASAVRAVARGEIDLCLTDTDDVWSAQRNGWPVGLVYETVDPPNRDKMPSFGSLMLPSTVGLVAGGPNPDEAGELIDFLLSERVERMMAESDSHNYPIRPDLAEEFSKYAVPHPARIEMERVVQVMDDAMKLCRLCFGR